MPKKIFELAKELDIGALDLVESLKAKGYAVRNHMTSLSDDEVEKVLAEYSSADQDKKPTEKKKVVKKAAKKKVVKKVAASAEGEESSEEDDQKAKTVTRRKKTVVVRKSSSNEEEEESAVSAEATQSPVEMKSNSDDEEINEVSEESEEISDEEESEPVLEAAAEEATEEVVEEETSETEDEKSPEELLNTKKFGLRVVSKPKVEVRKKATQEEEETEDRPKKKVFAATTTDDQTEESSGEGEEDDEKKREASKKRLGGLATMVSGKKVGAPVSRSQVLVQTKADEELKSYTALGVAGRPLYSTVKKKKMYSGPSKNTLITEVKESKRIVKLHKGADVEQLAKKLSVKLKDMIDACLDLNLLIKAGDYVGMKLASQIAALYQYRVEDVSFDESKVLGTDKDVDTSDLPLRNPIITIMGHVDHGKTTLLDYIRSEKVAAGEAGGITQHIGAYSVDVNGKKLTFLDTPGHAAFASMRQRGADVTDIVVLVVAADDGVMPQTKESIRFCQTANKPIIVAVNKMDKEGVNPDRIKQELTEFNITPEEWGGETQFCPISALKGDGVDGLLEAIALQAEILELRADPKGDAEGVVIESKVEQGRGAVATILVQKGTLKKGDSIVVGETFGRARTLIDSTGAQLNSAGPSVPVQILGLGEAPTPGDVMNVAKNEREAKKVAENRMLERKKLEAAPVKQKLSLEDFFAAAGGAETPKKELCLIVRTDVQGSFEAIKQSVEPLSNAEVTVRVIAGGAGPITDSDVVLATSSGAFILGFNMRPLTSARRLAEQNGVDVKTYSIIYELINDIKLAIEGLLDPDTVEEFIGRAEVRDTFSVPKVGVIAGSYVVDGKIQSGCNVRLLRNGKIIFDGKMSSLKRFKDDVKEVKDGYECGVGLEGFNDIRTGDTFEAYMMIQKKRTLEDLEKEAKKAANNSSDSMSI
ncbi:translation initiation factor IF-2 [Bacteriovorax sp. BSW11_IV]|uniref:translation initiation factor IF-2 n=1 Tax=Bacteriovorax sp. BSW11_IV TaxID=1353529 RepID=UPI00038A4021|nr:translation initiation factor IF-2 [Bacteriovorax sp. BSW11_IV]EQC49430.1 translation initiation factor IF-2 [Bacteriovorax sp. BSW11_IV]